MCQISTWSTKYCKRTIKKIGGQNTKKNWFAECHVLTLGKYALCQVPDGRHSAKCSLCRVFVGTLGKERANFFLKCLSSASPPGTQQSGNFVFFKYDGVRFRV